MWYSGYVMSGKPFQSVLRGYESEMREYRRQGVSYRQIAEKLNDRYGLSVTHNAVFSYLKRRADGGGAFRLFFDGLDPDLRESLLKQVCAVWTHDSTGLEGNALTLGETLKVLELGLTISGKPLRDHQQVYGHASAVDLMYAQIKKGEITEQGLFDLHQAVMQPVAADIMNPVGAWKREFNGTTGVIGSSIKYMQYAAPADTPALMKRWLKDFNRLIKSAKEIDSIVAAYVWGHITFVRIHPFFDGNGRVVRLIANIPVLLGGAPPIVLPKSVRERYISLLWEYQNAVGVIEREGEFLPEHSLIGEFTALVMDGWKETLALVKRARDSQQERVR